MKVHQSYKFVGGPKDGHRHCVPEGETTYEIAVLDNPELLRTYSSGNAGRLPGWHRETYRSETISFGDHGLSVWVHEKLSLEDAMLVLIASYKGAGND